MTTSAWVGRAGPAKEVDGVFTVTGSGDIADNPPDDDVVQISLIGVIIGSLVFIAVSVLFVTSEYRRGMIRTTFAAAGRRSQVLVSKAIVSAAVTFVVGLVASVTAFYLAQPTLWENGFAPQGSPSRRCLTLQCCGPWSAAPRCWP